jgi:pimeloyl-ACP methyl ester carboxylesterase
VCGVITTFVLVHGSFCNSAAWAPTVRELTLRGHRALAVDLPGHGLGATIPTGYLGGQDPAALAGEPSGMAGIGTADDVAAVTEVLRRARAHGPVVLVGHSRGGLTLTAVGNAVPELVDRLVYVGAWCCVAATVSEYSAGPEDAESLLPHTGLAPLADPARAGAIRLNWRTGDPDVLDRLQAAVLADGTRTELVTYLHHQEPDETIVVDEAATRGEAATWGRIGEQEWPHTSPGVGTHCRACVPPPHGVCGQGLDLGGRVRGCFRWYERHSRTALSDECAVRTTSWWVRLPSVAPRATQAGP